MLQCRRAAFQLARRPYRYQWRGYADSRPPDPTSSDRTHSDTSRGDGNVSSSSHAAGPGQTGPPQHDDHPEPADESLGRGFYVSIGAIALSFALYKFSRSASEKNPDAQPLLTRIIEYYSFLQDRYAQRNHLHVKMVEEAAHDRVIFDSSPWTHHIEMRFPEAFNSGSPFNVPAGHTADLSELKDFYQRKNAETEAKQLEKLAARAGDSEVLAQRREVAGGGQEKRRTSISSILEDYGFKRAGK